MACLRHSLNEVTATPAISADCFHELPAARASNAIITGAGMPSLSKTSSQVGRPSGAAVIRPTRSDDSWQRSDQDLVVHGSSVQTAPPLSTQQPAACPVYVEQAEGNLISRSGGELHYSRRLV